MAGKEKMILEVRPNLVDSQGNPLRGPDSPPEQPPPDWVMEMRAGTVHPIQGYFFRVVKASPPDLLVLQYVGPTKKTKERKLRGRL